MRACTALAALQHASGLLAVALIAVLPLAIADQEGCTDLEASNGCHTGPTARSHSELAIEHLRSLLADHARAAQASAALRPPTQRRRRREQQRQQKRQEHQEQLQAAGASRNQRRRLMSYKSVTQCLWHPPAADSEQGMCYFNPAFLGTPDLPDYISPVETMLMKTSFTAFQCHTIAQEGDCGKWTDPIDCVWFPEQGRCAVANGWMFKRLLTQLHCRDDTPVSCYWDRCYTVGLVRDDQVCNSPNSDWFKCYYFFARNDTEVDTCGPDVEGGVTRSQYDDIVAQMRSGVWLREWFGECITAELAFTAKSACNHTTPDACAADPNCQYDAGMPVEYGMCSLRDEVLAGLVFGQDSELFNATAGLMAECASASESLEACMGAGAGHLDISLDRFGSLADLTFIEELGGPAGGVRPAALLLAALAALAGAVLVRGGAGAGWLW